VQVAGTGVQITSVAYASATQINVYYQASSSAAGGTHNLTVTTVGGSSTSQVFDTAATLQEW
jgi:hypothetical protein